MICISQSNSSRKRTDRQEIQPFPTGRPNEIAVSRRRSPCAVWGAPYQQSRANSTQKPFFSTEARDRQIVAPSTIRRIAMATAARTKGKRPDMSPAEWAARPQLAACYRIFAHLGWSEMIYNHTTLRVPAEEKKPEKR